VAVAGFLTAARDRLKRISAERQLQSALESQPNAFVLHDANDRVITYNQRFVEMFPFLAPIGDLRGKAFFDLIAAQASVPDWTIDPSNYAVERMARHHAANGSPFDCPMSSGGWVRIRETRTPEGGIVSTWDDITELKTSNRESKFDFPALSPVLSAS
jgi:PAS domain-containing protein